MTTRLHLLPLLTLIALCHVSLLAQQEGMEGNREDFTLPELPADHAGKKMDSPSVSQEIYGKAEGGVGESNLLQAGEKIWKGKMMVEGNDLVLSQADPSEEMAIFTFDDPLSFPLTVDMKMKIEFFGKDSWFSLYATNSGKHIELRGTPKGLWDKANYVSFSSDEYYTFRFIIDGDAKGRVYLIDEKGNVQGSVGVVWCKYKQTDAKNGIQFRLYHAKAFIRKITIYDAMP